MVDEKSELKFNKEEILEIFKNHKTVNVIFKKKDGTQRTLVCSKNPEMIPEEDTPTNSAYIVSEHVIPVYDLENSGWRSFRVDSVISVTV